MLAEVERYAPPEPPTGAVDAAVAAIHATFKDALDFETTLNRYGLSRDELRRIVRDTLRLEAYLQQRFASIPQPSEDELVRYYRNQAAEFTDAGRLRPLDDVREKVRERVVTQRRDEFVRDWLTGLRRRATIVGLYLPGRPY
jgi:hypothetical protein